LGKIMDKVDEDLFRRGHKDGKENPLSIARL
jgi:hypothetical protein